METEPKQAQRNVMFQHISCFRRCTFPTFYYCNRFRNLQVKSMQSQRPSLPEKAASQSASCKLSYHVPVVITHTHTYTHTHTHTHTVHTLTKAGAAFLRPGQSHWLCQTTVFPSFFLSALSAQTATSPFI